MKNSDIFDVLIVYTSNIAISASSKSTIDSAPFPVTSKYFECNDSYGYFIETCQKNKMTVAFTTSADIIGAGKAKSYWVYENKKWVPVKRNCYAQQIFEKFQPVNSFQQHKRELLFSASHIQPFVDKNLNNIFADKQLIYETFLEFSIPTVTISDNSSVGIQYSIDELNELVEKHPNRNDFLPYLIMKDKFGSGGINVFRITSNFPAEIDKILKKNRDTSFVLQPFVKFDKGFQYKNNEGFTEVRFLQHGKETVQIYLSVASKDTFICNQNGGSIPLKKGEIPQAMYSLSKKIIKKLKNSHDIFALDFIMSNNGNVYLLEANSSPGVVWHEDLPEDVKLKKKTMNVIAKELARRVNEDNHSDAQSITQNYAPNYSTYSLLQQEIQK